MELLAVLVIVLLVIIMEIVLYKKYSLQGIEYTVRLSKNEVYEGEEVELIEEVWNRKRLPVPWLKSELSTSRWLAFKGGISATGSSNDSRFIPSVFALKANQKCTRIWKVKCLKRGVFTFQNTTIVATDIFGLVSCCTNFPVKVSITVLPTAMEIGKGELSTKEIQGEIVVRRFINDDPFIISGAKEYTGREPINRIHWNATASRNELMVYNNEYSTNHNVLVLMNMQGANLYDVACAQIRDIETFVKVSTTILSDGLNSGAKVGFATNGGGLDGFFIPPENNIEQFVGILRKLAELENVCNLEFVAFAEQINMSFFTDIAIVTTYVDGRILEFAHKLKHYGKNVIFYCNDDDLQSEYQLIPVNRISFAFGEGFDL